MLLHSLKVALRSLWKYRFFSSINIVGLSLGIAACLLILMHVRSELRYDRFHEKPEEIYRLGMVAQVQDELTSYPVVGYPWGTYLQSLPQVSSATRIFSPGNTFLEYKNERFEEEYFYYVDSSYQAVFSLEFISGQPSTSLQAPNQLVLTEASARKYFGETDALGKLIQVETNGQMIDMQVSGVVKAYPSTSHFHFDFLASISTLVPIFGGPDAPIFQSPSFSVVYTYFRTQEPEAVENQLQSLYSTKVGEADKSFLKDLFLQPLVDIHLYSNLIAEIQPNGNGTFVYIFIGVAILILLIACINFINLATALAANRSKEVGMRKVLGALKSHLIPQYLGESVIVTFISLLLALGFAELMRRILASTTDIQISFAGFADPFLWILILGILFLVGLAAGSYPALYLSRFQPLQVMRSNVGQHSKGGMLRKSLVVIQFIISTALLIGIGILFKQMNYIDNMDMGFEKENRLVIPLQIPQAEKKIRAAEILKKEFQRLPQVIQATATSNIPGNPRGIARVTVEGQPFDKVHNPVVLGVDYNYVETMALKILEGRALDEKFGTDSTESLLLNEAAVRELELPNDPLGVKLTFLPFPGANPNAEPDIGRVVGIYKDMHFEPVYRDIHPMILRIQPHQYNNLIVNIGPNETEATFAALEDVWNQHIPENPFAYTFLDQDLAKLYRSEQQLKNIITFFTLLAIFIACIGMFGLCAFTTAQRRKEISIRKVIGASSGSIVGLISKDFLILILIAFPFAAGLAWWASQSWLQTFAYQTQIGVGVYILAALASIAIAFLTISLLSYRAAIANPVDALYRD